MGFTILLDHLLSSSSPKVSFLHSLNSISLSFHPIFLSLAPPSSIFSPSNICFKRSTKRLQFSHYCIMIWESIFILCQSVAASKAREHYAGRSSKPWPTSHLRSAHSGAAQYSSSSLLVWVWRYTGIRGTPDGTTIHQSAKSLCTDNSETTT